MKTPEALLQTAARDLQKRHPGMSLRAVAAKLRISPSYWSKILRGQKPLPQKILPQVIRVLGLDSQQVGRLQRAMLSQIEKNEMTPFTGVRVNSINDASPIENYGNLGREDFWLLREWYLIPILNLLTLSQGPNNSKGLAQILGLSQAVVDDSIERLLATGFLEKTATGGVKRTNLQMRFPTDRSHLDVRNYHRSMIKKSLDVLSGEAQFDRRLIAGLNFAGSSAKVSEARLILEEALYRVANMMAGEPATDELYQLNVQLFPFGVRK
jgi:uncharacterized protein (TIGR02147 family)